MTTQCFGGGNMLNVLLVNEEMCGNDVGVGLHGN